MQIDAKTPEDYIDRIPDDRKEAVSRIRKIILENLPEGFEETINYGMIGYVVPHSLYPKGLHNNPKVPLPFINLASQKNYIALYHGCIYGNKGLLNWFISEYSNQTKHKPDMGKSCIRFKKTNQIPYKLIGELVSKVTVNDWIADYEKSLRR